MKRKRLFGTEVLAAAIAAAQIRTLIDSIGVSVQSLNYDISAGLHSVTYKGITGDIKFDAKGDRQQLAMVGFKVNAGKFVPTWKLVNGSWVSY